MDSFGRAVVQVYNTNVDSSAQKVHMRLYMYMVKPLFATICCPLELVQSSLHSILALFLSYKAKVHPIFQMLLLKKHEGPFPTIRSLPEMNESQPLRAEPNSNNSQQPVSAQHQLQLVVLLLQPVWHEKLFQQILTINKMYWISSGLQPHSLTIADYQELLDRGWRRSGCFLYKPEMESTCCPAYTIRLRVDKFTPSKEQQKVFRRMQRYVDGIWDEKKKEFPDRSEDSQGFAGRDEFSSSSGTNEYKSRDEELLICLSEEINLVIQSLVKSGDLPCDLQYPPGLVKFVSPAKKRQIVKGSEDLMFTSNISFEIAAVLRKAKENGSLSDLSPKTIAEKLASALQHLANSLNFSVKACNGHINYYSSVKETPSDKLTYRVSISSEFSTQHESKVRAVIPENPRRNKRKLEIHLKRSSFDPEEFALYKKYQTKVHNDNPDDVWESSYKRFLVDTPLVYTPPTNDNCTVPSCGFGSFHQQYRIDGRLIAVGVIDILPKCLSSKYLFWDPDLAFLSLGKYSALQEINWVIENQRHCSSLQYYYLGYYIHSCPKMRYKASYHPSELLCPLRYKWIPYVFAKSMLDETRYAVLSNYANIQSGPLSLTQKQNELGDEDSTNTRMDEDDKMIDPESGSSKAELHAVKKADLGDILLDKSGTRIRYKKLRPAVQARLGNQLLRYKEVVGRQLSERMIYSLY